jgi:3-hydroxyisobutyrate dehydrogenase-like beta-hydroxyacid dehydrogenase
VSHVGFIGAGCIGAPMIERLVENRHEVRALARSPEKHTAITGWGAQPATTLADVADVVIVCVFTDGQVREVCLESDLLPSMKCGPVLVVHTTGRPQTAAAIAARADRHFIDVVDAPINGGAHDAAAGQVTLDAGGGDSTAAQVCPVLASYGDPLLHVGPLT